MKIFLKTMTSPEECRILWQGRTEAGTVTDARLSVVLQELQIDNPYRRAIIADVRQNWPEHEVLYNVKEKEGVI